MTGGSTGTPSATRRPWPTSKRSSRTSNDRSSVADEDPAVHPSLGFTTVNAAGPAGATRPVPRPWRTPVGQWGDGSPVGRGGTGGRGGRWMRGLPRRRPATYGGRQPGAGRQCGTDRPGRLRRAGRVREPGPLRPAGTAVRRPGRDRGAAADGDPVQRVVQAARPGSRTRLAEGRPGRRVRGGQHAQGHLRRHQARPGLRRPGLDGAARRSGPRHQGGRLVPARPGAPAPRALAGPVHQGRTPRPGLQRRARQHEGVRPGRQGRHGGAVLCGPSACQLGRRRTGPPLAAGPSGDRPPRGVPRMVSTGEQRAPTRDADATTAVSSTSEVSVPRRDGSHLRGACRPSGPRRPSTREGTSTDEGRAAMSVDDFRRADPVAFRLTPAPVHDRAARLLVAGAIDLATADRLRVVMEALLADPQITRLVVDFAEVTFLDAAGISALVAGYRAAEARGIVFALVNCPPGPLRVLEIVALDKLLAGRQST